MERTITKVPTLPKLAKRKQVAAYTRVSTEKDAMLHSLSAQISYYSTLIQRHPEWQYAGVYTDEATTGTKDSRSAFQRMLTECRAGHIDMVITKSISRFARNTVTLLETVRELKSLGVDVFFEEQNIHSLSSDGELMLTILASYAQEESRSVSENCVWRIREKFRRGEPTWFRTFGYQMIGHTLAIVPEEAETVRLIFRFYMAGFGILAIANMLQELHIPAREGEIWHAAVVSYILQNERYCGDMMLQKSFVTDHLTKRKARNRGELPRYYVKGSHEPIIDREMFDRVQELYKRRRERYSAKDKEIKRYIFSGMLRCGTCGVNYRRKLNGAGTAYERVVWICTTYNTRGKKACASKQVPDDVLMSVTAQVLQVDELDRTVVETALERIDVTGHRELTFVFRNGTAEKVTWQDHSRGESWTDEMRLQAAEHARRRYAQ